MILACLAPAWAQSSAPNQAPPVQSAPPVPSAPPVEKAPPVDAARPAANLPETSPSNRQNQPETPAATPADQPASSATPAQTPPPEAVQIDATHPQGASGEAAIQTTTRAPRLRKKKPARKVAAQPAQSMSDRPAERLRPALERARPATATSGSGGAVAADNSKVNQRDLNPNEVTADQAKSNRSDRETARLIRHEIYSDKSLSSYAHNIKIIARDGKVTLKGPVRTAVEKAAVETRAKEIAGANNVTSEISVKPDSD